jgi:hypothetical protein
MRLPWKDAQGLLQLCVPACLPLPDGLVVPAEEVEVSGDLVANKTCN